MMKQDVKNKRAKQEIKPIKRMKCSLFSDDNGKTWIVEKVFYITSAETPNHKFEFEEAEMRGVILEIQKQKQESHIEMALRNAKYLKNRPYPVQ